MKTILALACTLCLATFAVGEDRIVDGDRAFFGQIKNAILNGDRVRFAALLLYPMDVEVGKTKRRLETSADTIAQYEAIVTEKVKSAVEQQKPDELWKNWRGVMIGRGEIWFDRVKPNGGADFLYRIIAINPMNEPRSQAEANQRGQVGLYPILRTVIPGRFSSVGIQR